MLELSEPLQTAVEQQTEPVEVIDPRTKVRYVLVRADVFEHLQDVAYDDSPWTKEEMALLAVESGHELDETGWLFDENAGRYLHERK